MVPVVSSTVIPVLTGYQRATAFNETDVLRVPHPCGPMCEYLLKGNLEFEAEGVLRDFVQPGDVVADIGAHVGVYTLLLNRLVGPTGFVVAWEPDPIHAACLALNVAANGLRNVLPIPAALGEQSGSVSLSSPCGDGAPSGAGTIPQVRADAFPWRFDGAKLDTQGKEDEILRGLGDGLQTLRWVMVEPHSSDQYLAVLEDAGFHLVTTSEKNGRKEFFQRIEVDA